jgi:hypothetical protein
VFLELGAARSPCIFILEVNQAVVVIMIQDRETSETFVKFVQLSGQECRFMKERRKQAL